MNMDLYITKHRIIQDYLHQLTTLINGTLDRANATLIAELINKTTGVLNMHLASEDSFVYPKLLESSDTRVRSITQRYMDEMTKIADAYLAFHKKYNTPSKILADTDDVLSLMLRRRTVLLYPVPKAHRLKNGSEKVGLLP